MVKSATRTIELEPIDRLEEKLKRLVAMVERLKSEQAEAEAENQRLTREVENLTAQLASNASLSSELKSLQDERDVIRTRVSEMLDQLESLNL